MIQINKSKKRSIYLSIWILAALMLLPGVINSQSTNENYILSRTYTGSNTYLDKIEYYDGLGRPVQTVEKGASPTGGDIVHHQEYDAFGRQYKSWLPVEVTSNSGRYVAAGTVSQKAATAYGDSYGFSETMFEPSPLNRVDRQYKPGNDWRINDRKVKTEYLTNATSGVTACLNFQVSGNNFTRGNYYPQGELYVTKLTDEDNKVSYEFKDKLGRVVLTRRINNGLNHDTYYLFDDYGNLRFVLPPLAVDNLTGSGPYTETTDAVAKYAYIYRYDYRNRCVEKKLPGAGWTYMVYDCSNKLILQQDANQRSSNKWLWYKYDTLEREILSGEITINSTRQVLEAQYKNLLVVERYSGSGHFDYSNSSQPIVSFTDIHRVNFYDKYDWMNMFDQRTNLAFKSKPGFEANYNSAQGMLTGSLKVMQGYPYNYRVLESHFYDYWGNLVQTHKSEYDGSFMHEYYKVNDYTGLMEKKLMEHEVPGQATIKEQYTYTYDHAGRIKSKTYQLDNNSPITMASYTYNGLGQLSAKNLAGIDNTTYTYNLRGWLKKAQGTRFSEELSYTSNFRSWENTYFGGNVSSLKWKSPGDTRERGFGFVYDGLGRLEAASYGEGSGLTQYNNEAYSEYYNYDKHGNINYTIRKGRLDNNTFGNIDNISYQRYDGNKVLAIHDWESDKASQDLMEFKNGAMSNQEYTYDANGNMTSDLNKKISRIEYNYLNLPRRIHFDNGSKTEYKYDASGGKHEVKYTAPGMSELTTSYLSNKIYENGVLKMILTEDGYVTRTGNTYNYYFYIKDRLGNNRVVVNRNGTVEQVNNYYPFGVSFAEYPRRNDQQVQPFKFGDKELDGMFGYNTYDFEARAYDPTISRFTTMDPLAEKYYSISPYAYCNNNPVNMVDPTGMDWYYGATGGFIYKDDKETENIRIVYNYEQQIARLSSASSSGSIDKSQLSSIGIENADLSAKAYSNIFTDILSKMEDVNVKELHKDKVSVTVFDGDKEVIDKYNSGTEDYNQNASEQGVNGKSLVTATIKTGSKDDNRSLYSTVSNVQNMLGVHELIGHGIKGFGDRTLTHHKAYEFQMSHSSWSKTTPQYKDLMNRLYQGYLKSEKK